MPRYALGDVLALSPPGIGRLTVREAHQLDVGASVISRDRRADVVGIRRPPPRLSLLTAEDVLAVAGTLPVLRTAAAPAAALDRLPVLEALSASGAKGAAR